MLPLAALVHGLGGAEGERFGLARAEAGAAAVARVADADLVTPLGERMGHLHRPLVQRQRRADRLVIHVEAHLGGHGLMEEEGAGQQGEPEGETEGVRRISHSLLGLSGPDCRQWGSF